MKRLVAVTLASLLTLVAAQAGLVEIENQFRAAYELGVGANYSGALAELDGKYGTALERAMQDSTKAGKLEEALALKQELERVAGKQPLPEKDDDADPAVAKFRGIYRGQIGKLQADRDKAAAPDKPFENSLGMKFVPVPIVGGPSAGKTIRFSIWETRVQDYEKFVKDTKTEWPTPNYKQGSDHPAVNVSWEDATAFCAWLTKEERKKRKIGPNDAYRLPSDHEWSCAVGIGKDEDASLAPVAKQGKVPGYPWGNEFPPPGKVGNYNGEETARNPVPGQKPIQGSNDGFDRSTAVGSFPANASGIFDLGGNVREWCQDWYDPAAADRRVSRGGSWRGSAEVSLRSSSRFSDTPTYRNDNNGFRLVLEVGSGGEFLLPFSFFPFGLLRLVSAFPPKLAEVETAFSEQLHRSRFRKSRIFR